MKLISIACRVPAVERKGDQVLGYRHLSCLARNGYSIDLICFADLTSKTDLAAKLELENLGIKVHFIKWSWFEAVLHLIPALFSPSMPFQCAIFRSRKFTDKFRELTSFERYDALYCVLARVAVNATGFPGAVYVDLIDSMKLNFTRRAKAASWVTRWLLLNEARRIGNYESLLANASERAFVVSEIDMRAIGSERVAAIPLGVDFSRFCGERMIPANPVIVFTGNMNYGPNIEAILWFVKHCWPAVKKLFQPATLIIAGSNPVRSITRLSSRSNSIVVTGRVPSIAEVYLKSTVAIAPMQSGSGMQFKILEAMACSVPVVTTSIGLEGIGAVPGRDLVVKDNAEQFSASLCELIASRDLNRTIGLNGHEYVVKHHDWKHLNERFYGFFLNAASGQP